MNPRSWYVYVSGAIAGLALIVGGVFLWKRRAAISASISNSTDKVRGTARSVWGKVENAASKLTHTERDPREQN